MPPSHHDASSPKVLFATPECAPLVKTGGLGDVSAALPQALAAEGLDVHVLLPGYPPVLDAAPRARELARFEVLGHPVRLLESRRPSAVPLLVLDCPPLYQRDGGPYQDDQGEDWKDNALRFGVLARCAATLGTSESPIEWRPDVVHCNDWPTAWASLYLHFASAPHAASVVTIHNLAFQGLFPYSEIDALDIPARARGMEGVEFYGQASFLKGGIVYADAVTTVSPTYAREIQTKALGFGLEDVLRHRRASLHGVLNGIDTNTWNPENDPHLAACYGAASLGRKLENKRRLRERMRIAGPDEQPLFACVSRITHQKGMDVLAEAIPHIVALGAQVAVVGTGDREMVGRLKAQQAKDPSNVSVFIGFDETMAHLVEGGADAFLMPSRFEPCGMNQMYSQRYGTPPIANATGGLVDTIFDAGHGVEGATGFLIHEASVPALLDGVRRALAVYRDAAQWRRIQLNGMARDFGWGPAARAYAAIYRGIRSTS